MTPDVALVYTGAIKHLLMLGYVPLFIGYALRLFRASSF